MRPRWGLTILAVLLAGCSAAGSELSGSREFALAGEQWAELDFVLAKGESLTYELLSTAPIEWDIHSHDGAQLTTWTSGAGLNARGAFEAPIDAKFSFWLGALGSPAQVSVSWSGAALVEPG